MAQYENSHLSLPRSALLVIHLVVVSVGEDAPCPQPEAPDNGHVQFRVLGGLAAIFTCNSGYELKGTNVSHCQTDGHWSALPPTCQLSADRCKGGRDIVDVRRSPGSSVVVDCRAKSPLWLKDGSPVLESSSNVKVLPNASLSVRVQSPTETGLYVCLAHTPTTVRVAEAVRISLEERRDVAARQRCRRALDYDVTKTVRLGSTLKVACENEEPDVVVTWYKDESPLHYDAERHLHVRSGLWIRDAQARDSGIYTCVVTSLRGSVCTVTTNVKVSSPSEERSMSDSTTVCGRPVGVSRPRRKRIVDGTHAAPNSVPWMCMVSTEKNPVYCGCSLVSSRWVLTAAHCFAAEHGSDLLSERDIKAAFVVKLGKRLRRQTEPGEMVSKIHRPVVHPLFRPRTSELHVTNEHDIALLQLSRTLEFQDNILPICLPYKGFVSSYPPGSLGTVTGWGRVTVKESIMAVTLQEAHLPLVSREVCQDSTAYGITDNMLCAGFAESYKADTCYGDSGGPFSLQRNGTWYIAGIVSWGEGCSSPRKYGIYTKVENYIEWIQSNVGNS